MKQSHFSEKLVDMIQSEEFCSQDTVDPELVLTAVSKRVQQCRKNNVSFALVVYSLSEIVLAMGWRKAQLLVTQLTALLAIDSSQPGTDHSTNSGIASGFSTYGTPTLIFVVHESLHSESVLSHMQSLVSVVVRVVPNGGTLSPDVAAEMQVVRTSPSTGKVTETVEMFSLRDCALCLIPSTAMLAAEQATDSSPQVAETEENGSQILSKLLSTTATGGAASAENSAAVISSGGGLSRLITFDSTDPEFDEDSDPDADLDL